MTRRGRPTLRPGVCCLGRLVAVVILAARAGPGEIEAVGVGLGRDQGGMDRGGEGRIVERDRVVGEAGVADLLPGCPELDLMWCTT